jgi:hypothetical protein
METGSDGWEQIESDGVAWRFDRAFLRSKWSCIWGRGCLGILAEPAEELQQGCCSVGAHLDGPDEAGNLETLAGLVEPERFQFHAEATEGGVFADADRTNTRIVDGACVFLNRPGFTGGAGCALHLQAEADGERPIDWKPSVCWQLPIHVDWEPGGVGDDAPERATVRAWNRPDWGDDGDPMHWCCTEGDRAYVGAEPVIDSLAEELTAMVGTEVYVELRRRILP